MVLGSRDRYQIRFRTESPEKSPLHFCPADQSLWLSREDAVAHLLRSPVLNRYYDIKEVSVEPPTGNFAVVAVCGFSGTILGPPNHHEYSMNVARLHRERFSDMSLDRYKARIEMRRDEETIEKWKTELSTQRQYEVRPEPLTADPATETEPEAVPATDSEPKLESVAEAVTEAPESGSEEVDATEPIDTENVAEDATPDREPEPDPVAETEAEPDTTADENNDAEIDEEPATEEDEVIETPAAPAAEVLTSSEALERHFKKNFADHAVETVAEAVLPGNVGGRFLSRPLLNLLKSESERSRKGFPLTMIQLLCREFENAGLKFFKRGKKALHVSVARPRAIPNETELTERIQEIVRFVREKPKSRVADLLDALVEDYVKPPKGETFEEHHLTEKERAVLADLRWLTMEGFIIEFPNTELMLGRTEPAPDQPAKPKKKRTRPPRKRKEKIEGTPTAENTPETTDSPSEPEKMDDTAAEPSAIAEESITESPTEPTPSSVPAEIVIEEEKPAVQETAPEIQPEADNAPDEADPTAN
ncbi:MAG: hypothetical protein KDN20_09030 [Verrucomicrobiae bacterium]|nr:hypothetical protein [Verrucomicrobiae bacterium]